MRGRWSRIVLCVAVALATIACGAPVPSPSPSPSPAVASSFDEYATAFCTAWGTLFRVVGNPETATWADAVDQLQAAAKTRDSATAARLQGEINTQLEAARGQIAYAAGWPPAARLMAETDRFFRAMETWITAHVNVAKGVPGAPDPQAALEEAGGIAAWGAMWEAYADVAPHRPASVAQCPGAPVSP